MILFTPEMAKAILDGRKTVTRRRWKKPRVKVGSIHLAYTRPAFARPPGKPFARVRIVSVIHEDYPGHHTRREYEKPHSTGVNWWEDWIADEARREGFASWTDFTWTYMNMHVTQKALCGGAPSPMEEACYRVEFELMEASDEVE